MLLYLRSALVVLFFAASVHAVAQVNAPFSRFGLGDFRPSGLTLNRSMGGIGAAVAGERYMNTVNPASYAAFYREVRNTYKKTIRMDSLVTDTVTGETRKVFYMAEVERDSIEEVFKYTKVELALFTERVALATPNAESSSANAELGYLNLGFALPPFGGLAVGVQPLSSMRYSFKRVTTADSAIGEQREIFNGTGNINRAFLGLGVRVHRFRIGANLNYAFGSLNRSELVWFPDVPNAFGSFYGLSHRVGGLFFDAGVQYEQPIAEEILLTAGFTARPASNLRSQNDTVWDRVAINGDESFASLDSVYEASDENSSLPLPSLFRAGLNIQKRNVWQFGVDYEWSEYAAEKPFNDVELGSASQLYVGGAIRTSREDASGLGLTSLRLGFHTGQRHILVNNEPLREFGITFGVGLPIRRQTNLVKHAAWSTVDLGFDIGTRSTIADHGLRHNYLEFTLGLNFNDNSWFVPPKIK